MRSAIYKPPFGLDMQARLNIGDVVYIFDYSAERWMQATIFSATYEPEKNLWVGAQLVNTPAQWEYTCGYYWAEEGEEVRCYEREFNESQIEGIISHKFNSEKIIHIINE